MTRVVVWAAAKNSICGAKIIKLFLDLQGVHVSVTEEVVRAAARCEVQGVEVTKKLLDRLGTGLEIKQGVIEEAAESQGGAQVIKLQLCNRTTDIKTTEVISRQEKRGRVDANVTSNGAE